MFSMHIIVNSKTKYIICMGQFLEEGETIYAVFLISYEIKYIISVAKLITSLYSGVKLFSSPANLLPVLIRKTRSVS
jgi:hypothetical protein